MKQSRMKKVLGAVTILTVLSQTMLTGCGSKDEAAASTAAPTATVAANPTKEFVNLNWYTRKPIDNMKDQDSVEAEANRIIKEKINANLHLNLIEIASWEDKMKMMSAAGEVYDLVLTSSWHNRLDLNVQRGAFKPLDELLDKYGPNIKKKVDSRAWKAATYNGKIMAVPAQQQFSAPSAFVFKKDMVEKYNFNYRNVKTMADLEPYLETIKKNEPNMIPLFSIAKVAAPGVINFDQTDLTKGVSVNEKTGKIELSLEMTDTIANFRKINEYYKKGYIAKDASTKTDSMAESKSGKYAVMHDSGGYTEDGSKSTGAYGFPCVESLYGYPVISTGAMVSASTAISNTSKNPERAMMLLDLVWSDRYLLNTLAFGLEGKNYTVVSGKGTDAMSVTAKSGAEQTWAIWHNWLGPLWDQWDSNWNSTKALQLMKDNNEKARTSVALGFLFNNESVKTEVGQVSSVYAEIEPVLNSGVAPDFDKYLADSMTKLKTAGIDKVKAEVQKQYDAWKASTK